MRSRSMIIFFFVFFLILLCLAPVGCIDPASRGVSEYVSAQGASRGVASQVLSLGSGTRKMSFAIIADPHVNDENDAHPGWDDGAGPIQNSESARLLSEIVNDINSKISTYDIRFVAVLGDLSESAELSELNTAEYILSFLNVPYIPLLGNHDVWPYIACKGFNDITSSFKVINGYCNERVELYEHKDYSGKKETFIGDDRHLGGNYIGNDSVSSLKVIGSCTVTLYQDDDFTGSSKTFTGPCNVPNLSSYGWNDKVSSIKITECDSRGVILHGGADYNEQGHLFFSSVSGLPAKDYNGRTCSNDAVSCVQLVGGAEVRLYSNSNYGGLTIQYGSSQGTPSGDPNLDDEYVHPWDTMSDYYFNNVFGHNYYDELHNFSDYRRASVPVWTPETTPPHYSYFQNGAFTIGDFHFIWLDFNARDDAPFDNPGVSGEGDLFDFSGGTYQWLQNHLVSHAPKGNENIIIFAHHSICDPAADLIPGGWMGFSGGEKNKLRDLFTPYRNSLYYWFSGHLHVNGAQHSFYDSDGNHILYEYSTDEAHNADQWYYGEYEDYENAGDYRIIQLYR